LASGLLTQQQLDEARSGGRWSAGDESESQPSPTDQQLADRLVETGRLNAWQAKQLLEGRTKFTLGHYLIVDSLGQGGMGQVFKAEHSILGREVAIKVLPLSKTTPDAVTNFSHESRAMARLDHPRLVRALDAGYDGNVYYLVTEYVPGSDLRKLVRRNGPLDMSSAAEIISQVAEGLDYAHRQGLVHRDVKPGNVLVTPQGEAKLSDLGLAGPLEGNAENDPRYGKIVGTADYVSPDHVHSPWDPTPAWDIYSLGCTLYYAVTGKVPFPGGTTAEKARAHCELRPLDPRRLNPGLSDEFVDVLADMMAKDPAQRIQSAAEVILRLSPWTSRPVSAEVWQQRAISIDPAGLPGGPPLVVPRLRLQPIPESLLAMPPAAAPRTTERINPGDTEPDPGTTSEPAEDNQDAATAELRAGDGLDWAHPAAAPTARMDVERPAGPRRGFRRLGLYVLLPLAVAAAVATVWGMVWGL
jgi:serine/threonine protein kinase